MIQETTLQEKERNSLRVAIVEDQESNSALLQEYLERYGRENGEPIRCAVYHNGMEFTANYRPIWDLILMDIEMPRMNGMETAHFIRQTDTNVLIIFITQMAQYAIEGYSVQALDYVLKPVQYFAFAAKMQQVSKILAARSDAPLLITSREGMVKLPLSAIYYVEVRNHTLCFHTKQNTIESTAAQTMSGLSQELAGKDFARCHQGYLLNLRHVMGYDRSCVKLPGCTLPMSRTYYKGFVQALISYCAEEGSL